MPRVFHIVYVGSLDPQSNSFRRFKTLQQLGHRVVGLDIDPIIMHTPFSSIHYRLNIGPGIFRLNKLVRKIVCDEKPDLLFVDNKSYLTGRTLQFLKSKLPGMKLANLVTDDPTGHSKSAWRLSIKTAPFFNIHFVQRKVNISELMAAGAQKVSICHRSFDPAYHRRMTLNDLDYQKYHCKVGFVGTHEDVRESYIAELIKAGIPVFVTGNDWPNKKHWDTIKPYYRGPSTYGEEYIKIINGMDIALHFLRHGNRDEQDSRTFEIPACGAFMLAEDSELHRQLFEPGKEAVFFNSKEELLDKVKYYLANPEERRSIADAGMKRCHDSAYTHEGRLIQVMKEIAEA